MAKLLDADIYKPVKEWQSLSGDEFVDIAKSIWGDNLGMSYATLELSSKLLLLLKKIDEALREKNG